MSRPWVKLDSAIYRHPELVLLPDGVWRRFVECIAMAGDLDRDGELSSVAGTARLLGISEKQLRTEIGMMGSRILIGEDGIVRVRDWAEWQPPTSDTERSRRHRERLRNVAGDAGPRCATEDATLQQRRSNALELEVDTEGEQEMDAPLIGGGGAAVAAPVVVAPSTPSLDGPSVDEPVAVAAPSKRQPPGPGVRLFRRLTNASPNIEQRQQLEAAFVRHGPERMESVIRDWLLKGYRKQNVKGMLNVLEVGWRERRPGDRGVLANGHGATPDEAVAIDRVIAEGMEAVAVRLEASVPPAEADAIWRDVHAGLALRMPAATLKAWVDPVQAIGFDGQALLLQAPNAAVHSWLTTRLARELDEALAEAAPGVEVVVLTPEAALAGAAA